MDQIKIGKFISQMRKEKELTQRQLADKTVSKWETGKGLPEVSLMILETAPVKGAVFVYVVTSVS